nr:helix-turn-helix transcriptional regulator [Leptolyngbya sp. FACHB-671]
MTRQMVVRQHGAPNSLMKKDRRPQESDSPIEKLRIQRTNLSQAEFAVQCGIPLRTYQRWVSGETEPKLTPRQWKTLMQILEIQSVDEIPDDFSPG